ncbi:hypothetical protein FHS24_001795 [Psychrobacter luti]|uniref:Uncharacterized protein n=1 Tax=Psychrobacter luti TaxID=198481 RepID=A0A839TDM1_9GAMM|nr:hypothetical protein [Psychrobacter luti]MBB3107278.1 hypothetical protein [Psychrobacter luti]
MIIIFVFSVAAVTVFSLVMAFFLIESNAVISDMLMVHAAR